MKKLNLVSIVILFITISFTACEEGLDVSLNTTFMKNINIDIQESRKSADNLNVFPFYAADSLDITDNSQVQENIDKFKDLEISKITCKLTGIPENESISELSITIPEADLSISLTNLSENNNTIDLEITTELLDALANFLYANHQATIQISGVSSYAPMQLGVELSFESTIVTNL